MGEDHVPGDRQGLVFVCGKCEGPGARGVVDRQILHPRHGLGHAPPAVGHGEVEKRFAVEVLGRTEAPFIGGYGVEGSVGRIHAHGVHEEAVPVQVRGTMQQLGGREDEVGVFVKGAEILVRHSRGVVRQNVQQRDGCGGCPVPVGHGEA